MSRGSERDHRPQQGLAPTGARSRRRLATGLMLAGLWWSGQAQASPPESTVGEPGGLSELPAPEDLPELEGDLEPEPEPRSSPPEDDAGDADEDADAGEDSDEDEGEDSERDEDEQPKLQVKTLKKAKWIKHEIIPGERLDEIAARYQVRKASLIRWNKLDENKPRIYAGRELAVYTKFIPPPQQELIYTVQFGDSWNKIAKAYRVDPDKLRLRWNPKVPRKFKAGQTIVIWVDPLDDPDLLRDADTRTQASAGTSTGAKPKPAAKLPLATIKSGSISVGKPNRGKIVNPQQLPKNTKLYTVRKPDESYGSSHTLHNLQLAIANWRQATGYTGDLVIGAISKQGGGRLRPHRSHQSGRDVDVRLPLRRKGGDVDNVDDIDWDATWGLIQALIATGEIQYIFLSTSRQKHLYKAAKRAGASKDMLERAIQHPRKSGTNSGIVRDANGHTGHFHVRFTCAPNETRCESY